MSIADDPKRISDRFPDGAPWDGNITPRMYVMKDGEPRNDPETGKFEIPRIRDDRFARSAALLALYPEQINLLLSGQGGTDGSSLGDDLGIELYSSRETAFLAHPEFEWDRLGKFAGVDF